MRRWGAVQRKVPCLFVTEVKEEPSAKRERQPFKVLATETVTAKAIEADIYSAIPTEKVDGTCCYVATYKGQPCLWARLDRKPNKQAEKKFKQFLYSLEDCKEFAWNMEEDFKPVPDTWIPAKDVEFSNGSPLPDENGHMPAHQKDQEDTIDNHMTVQMLAAPDCPTSNPTNAQKSVQIPSREK